MKQLLVPVILALLGAGCTAPANSPSPATPAATQGTSAGAAPTPTVLPSGEYTLDTRSGARVTFKLPSPATDPALAELEAFRKKAGGKAVSYIVADVDNRNGTELVNIHQINAFDKEGREYPFRAIADALATWEPIYRNDFEYKLPDGRIVDHATADALSREAAELRSSSLEGADVAGRAKIILGTTDVELPDGFTRVSVQLSRGAEGEEAVPVQR